MTMAAVVVVSRSRVAVGADIDASTIAADDTLEDELPHAILGNGAQITDDIGTGISSKVNCDGIAATTAAAAAAAAARALEPRNLLLIVEVAEGGTDPGRPKVNCHGDTCN